MLAGTVVASLGDKYGRRTMCILYSCFYGAGCLTKLSSDFYFLILGRVLSGIATSLLFSSFESWMVCSLLPVRLG
jgi:predicted MFS family arabinose efflux permease